MNRVLWVAIILQLFYTVTQAGILEVCNDCDFTTIQPALSESMNGDTILVSGGVYEVDNIFINKPITILGKDKATITSRKGDEIFTITSDSVNIHGLIFKNVTTSYLKERSAIRIVKSKDFSIRNNIIKDCFFGIYLEKSNRGVVIQNQISGNAVITEADSGNGIHAWHCKQLVITDNRISGHRDGIYFEFVSESKISENHSEGNNRYGLHFMFSNDDDYTDNTFKDNGVGVAVMFSRRIKMSGNTFSYNWGRAAYGLLLKEIFDADIIDNDFIQNTIGIFVEGSNRIKYQNNNFTRNGWAIKFSGGCEDNDVSKNNFINNSMDLVMNTKLSSNRFHHNYWSSYSGYDLDKDGLGDVPYYPVKLFSYILDQVPEAIILMRSLFIDLINFSERVSPIFTPKELKDDFPLMKQVE